MPTPTEFNYAKIFISGAALASEDLLHDELSFKLGLSQGYARNWQALQDCLASIDDPALNRCAHWQFHTGERMILQIVSFTPSTTDPKILVDLVDTIAAANSRLEDRGQDIRIWLDFAA